MASEQPPIDTELDASEAKATDDLLYDELVHLRVVGLQQDIEKDNPLLELTRIADAICADKDPGVERFTCAIKRAAQRFEGKYGMALEALWGTGTTYGLPYDDRRKKAMPLLGGKQTKAAFNKSHRERTARDLAAQLRALYKEAKGAERAPPHEGLAVEQRRSGIRGRLSTRRSRVGLVAVLLLVAGICLVGLFAFSGKSSPAVPPAGTVIDATTGEAVAHVVSRTTPQFVQVGGGSIFEACDRTTHPGCGVTGEKGIPLRVHIGDVVEFSTSLFNPNDIPVPYLRMYASTSFSSAGPGDWIAMSIKWPTAGHHWRSPVPIDRVEVIYPNRVLFPSLTYLPGSTVLLKPHDRLLTHLPDGIMEGGIALANVGPPASCSYCEQEYQRHVNFKMRVTAHGKPTV